MLWMNSVLRTLDQNGSSIQKTEPFTVQRLISKFLMVIKFSFYSRIFKKVVLALKRRHQLATVQLDFQLPQRFNLKFIRDNKEETPVIIHRAILGSLERCIAILCESFGGKWPFWLSPRQVKVVPVGPAFDAYAKDLANQLYAAGLEAEADANQGKF